MVDRKGGGEGEGQRERCVRCNGRQAFIRCIEVSPWHIIRFSGRAGTCLTMDFVEKVCKIRRLGPRKVPRDGGDVSSTV